ncbi:MAG: tRNA lysidine(34) synthetase TilS [Actinomycetota bacterium]
MTERLARALAPWRARLVGIDDVGGPVVVACSGGADSLALLALVRAHGLAATAVYVDHGLRPRSEHDAHVVRGAARALGADVVVVSVDVAAGGNLAARARAARYRALERVRADLGADAILVGHTRDDQAETVLLNVLRGSATAGLAGMPARRDHIRRPLLALRRADTHEICARLRFAPVQDPMNDDARYRRVWLRREVLPRLTQGARRDLVEVLARQAALARDDDALLASLASEAMPPASRLDAAHLVSLPVALARRVVRQWLGIPASFDHVEAVLAVARGERRAAELPGRRIERVRQQLHVIQRDGSTPAAASLVLPGNGQFGTWTVDAWVEEGPPASWPDGAAVVVTDAAVLGERATVRAARAGDRFHPIGARGAKGVLDALAEVGVPAAERRRRPVMVDAVGRVCWVVGYRIDERVRVTSHTRRFLWIEASTPDPERAPA